MLHVSGDNPYDSMSRRKVTISQNSSRMRVPNPIPFEGGRGRLYGQGVSLAEARENPTVSDDDWKRNLRRQAREIVTTKRSSADLIYMPPPNVDSFEAESVEEFWNYIRNKIDGELPAHAEIEDWSVINNTLPGSPKSKAFNGKIKYWQKWHGAYIPEMEEDVSREGKVKLKMIGHDRRANNLIDGYENPNTEDIAKTKARTQYFLLTLDHSNAPGMDSYGELLKIAYYEIVRNEKLQGRYVCNCSFIDDPIQMLAKKFGAALEKNIKKQASMIVTRNPTKIFDFSRSIQMAVGHGAADTKLAYDLVGKTFYVPGSAYDVEDGKEEVDAMEDNATNDFAVLTNEDAYKFMFEHFREMFYHVMLGKEDMNNTSTNKYLTICEKTYMNNIFELQVAYQFTLCFRIVMFPM